MDVISFFIEEIKLLEQRILHLENIQYKLRQFSITLWIAVLGVATGANLQQCAQLFILVIVCFTPMLFMYIDAWYATNAQYLRSRRNEITHYINLNRNPLAEMPNLSEQPKGIKLSSLPFFDLTGYLTLKNDPQTKYRSSIIAKLTRRHRLLFYSFQIVGSLIALSHSTASIFKNKTFY